MRNKIDEITSKLSLDDITLVLLAPLVFTFGTSKVCMRLKVYPVALCNGGSK